MRCFRCNFIAAALSRVLHGLRVQKRQQATSSLELLAVGSHLVNLLVPELPPLGLPVPSDDAVACGRRRSRLRPLCTLCWRDSPSEEMADSREALKRVAREARQEIFGEAACS